MNALRPSALHPSRISPRSMFSSVANNSIRSGANAKAANFAWKYWRRSYNNRAACWNQLRLHHLCTAEVQNADHRESRFPIKACASPAPLLSSLPPNLLEATSISLTTRYMSSSIPKSKVGFSTSAMPHSTSASRKGDDKEIKNEETIKDEEIAKMPASKRARALFNKYGAVFVGTYLGIYVTTLLSFFVTLDFGLLDPDTLPQLFKVSKDMACETADIIGPTGTGASMNEAANAYADECTQEISEDKRTLVDIISGYLKSWEWTSNYVDKLSDNPHLANFGLAWFMVKFTEPVRLAAAVIVTPKVASALGPNKATTGEEGDKNTAR